MGNKRLNGISAFLLIIVLFLASCGREKEKSAAKSPVDSIKLALEELNKKIAGDESNPGLYNQRAKFYLSGHEFDNALKDINKAISLSANKPEYYITLSDIYILMGRPQNCGDALKKAIMLDPRNEEALLKTAKLNLILKEYANTYEYVRKALDVDQINPQAHFIRAIALLENGDTNKAIDDLRIAVNQDQNYYDALLQLGEIYSIKKNILAIDYFNNALNIKPGSKEALYMLGMFYQENGYYEKAIQTYQTLRKTDSVFKNAPYNIGYIYLVYLKDFKQAAFYFSQAMKCDPGYIDALYNRGLAYENDGDYEKAYSDYDKTLKLKTNYQRAIDGLNRLDKLGYRK
jgi:tetratricopeptide (TPR) repeat protein